MVRIRHRQREHVIAGVPDVTLTSADTGFHGITRFGAAGISYQRPVRVELRRIGVTIPIRDHLMMVRIGAVALVLALNLWRWLDDR